MIEKELRNLFDFRESRLGGIKVGRSSGQMNGQMI